jgi:hypothetical protein
MKSDGAQFAKPCMKPRLVYAAGLVFGLAACWPERLPTPRQASSETDLEDVRAALLRYVNAQARPSEPGSHQVTCVRVENEQDPSPALLSRLSGYPLHVRKASRCVFRGGDVVDAIDGSRGLLLYIDSVQLREPGKASGEGGYMSARKTGMHFVCELEFRLGEWEVSTEVSRIWI